MFNRKKSSMELEIFKQSTILKNILEAYVDENSNIILDVPTDISKIVLVASGSSYNCARYAADLFGNIAGIEARAMYSSEFLLKSTIPHSEDILYVFITQSGETTDTNKALVRAKEFGMRTMSVTNKKDSTIWQASDYKMNCLAGEEKSIAATKSLTSQMLCLTILAFKYAQIKNVDVFAVIDELKELPEEIEKVYSMQPEIKKIAKFLSKYKSLAVTADGISYALAKEIALKIKETSYINSNAMILGEFMHGHVAVLNKKIPLIYVESSTLNYTTIKNLNKIKEEYKPVLCMIGSTNDKIQAKFTLICECENVIVKAFCTMVIGQILALEIAKSLHRNVDKPKGLNKVVV